MVLLLGRASCRPGARARRVSPLMPQEELFLVLETITGEAPPLMTAFLLPILRVQAAQPLLLSILSILPLHLFMFQVPSVVLTISLQETHDHLLQHSRSPFSLIPATPIRGCPSRVWLGEPPSIHSRLVQKALGASAMPHRRRFTKLQVGIKAMVTLLGSL